MGLSDSFFGQKFGITAHDLESYLSEALSAGGEYADLYFEYLATSNISIDESIVKSAVQGVSLGVGVRVVATLHAERRLGTETAFAVAQAAAALGPPAFMQSVE